MKASEIRSLPDAALENKLKELHQESFNLRFQAATHQLQNSARVRDVRRDIARIGTILNERKRTSKEG
ncbi:MAG: 50S ribosomal protein L29 [Magnetococcales bacterium]|nr:50S ribosomal protein L29 [Magnetococcales bacterium]NGZ27510.1 50S ribosomal protein L29 [Magnetococcales bacterium]